MRAAITLTASRAPTLARRVIDLSHRYPDRAAALAILLLATALFGRALLPGAVLSPADIAMAAFPLNASAPGLQAANPLAVDVAFMFHPWLVYTAGEIAAGRFPLWNPHVFTGAPFFANPQTALLFPLTGLAYILPVPTAVGLAAILKLATAGLGTYWFLRQLAVTPWPALVAGTTFMLSGVMVVWLHWSYASAVALAPVVLAVTERLRRRNDAVSVASLAVALALLVFAGYPQGAVLAACLAGAWALCGARRTPRPARFLLAWGGGVSLGLAAAAVQILPFLEYLAASAVLAYRDEWMWRLVLPPRGAIAALMPFYYGSPMGRDFWGPTNFNEVTTSVGLVAWPALSLAVALAWRRTGVRFFLVVGVLAGAMVFGVPVVGPLLAGMPPFSMAIPTRLVSLLALALAVLTGLGLQAAVDASPAARERARRITRATFAGLAAVAFTFVAADAPALSRTAMLVPVWVQYVVFLGLLTAASLLVLGLVMHTRGPLRWLGLLGVQLAATVPLAVAYNPVIDARLFYPEPPPLVRHLQAMAPPGHGRVLFDVRQVPNLGMLFNLAEVGGYDGMTPRRIDALADPEGSLDSLASGVLEVTAALDSPLVNLLGIRHVAVPPNGRQAPPWPLEWQGGGGRIYRNPRAVPRASLVSRATTCVDDARALELLRTGAVDPMTEVLLATCDAVPAVGPPGAAANAEIATYAAEHVLVRATSDASAWLVLTDTWFPGWRAWVNGVEQPIHRANYGFRAVWLPAGRHEIEFRYRPRSLTWGLSVSLGAAMLIVGLLWRGRRR